MLLQGEEDGFLYSASLRNWVLTATVVAKVCPPFTTDKTSLLVEELTIYTSPFRHNGTFPLPQRPVPTSIGKGHITAILCHHFLGREAHDAAIEQWEKPDLLDTFNELGSIVDFGGVHGVRTGSR